MSTIFGGSKSTSNSNNQAFGQLNQTFSPLTQQAGQGMADLSSFMGGDTSGFNKFKDATGFNFAAEQGSRGVTGNAAARGMLRSGATGKGLVEYGNNIQNQFANNYMDRLFAKSGIGLQAGNLIAGAGQQSTSTQKSKPGMGGFLGQIAGGIAASDRRLKENIIKLGKLASGLFVYSFDYKATGERWVGLMADEVARLQPSALGPKMFGYDTVDYSKIDGWEGWND